MALIARPVSAAKRVTVAQLEQALSAYSGSRKADQEIARQLSGMELTERLTDLTLVSLKAKTVLGSKSVLALEVLADQSAFLMPPSGELPTATAPDDASQQKMLDAARDYVANLLPRLPNFVAVRTTKRYDDSPQTLDTGGWPTRYGLHMVDIKSRETSLLEERDNGTPDQISGQGFGLTFAKGSAFWQAQMGMISGGEFGSTLVMIMTDTTSGKVTWSHWEQSAAGQLAVFNYSVPKSASHYTVIGSVYREVASPNIVDTPRGGSTGVIAGRTNPSSNPANTSIVRSMPGYHGSFWIDPSTGTVLRVTIESDTKDSEPFRRAAIMVEYGPVQIGDGTFVCPTRSVALTLATYSGQHVNIDAPTEWLNETLFTGYRRFGSTTRVVTNGGDSPLGAETGDREVRQRVQQAYVPQTGSANPDETTAAGVSGKPQGDSAPALPSRDVNSPAAPAVSAAAAPTATVSAPAVSSPAASTVQPQSEPQPIEHAIQVNVNRVLVPVVVRDKNGLFVGSLKKEDFQIFDDGKPRSISNFTVEKSASASTIEKSPQPANATSSASEASAIPARIIVFLFDDLHLTFEDIAHVQKAGINALKALSDSGMAAVVTISGTNSGLTRDHQKLQDAIMNVKPVGLYHASTSDCPNIGYYQANLIENQRDSTATAEAIEQVFNCDPALDRQRDHEVAARLVTTAATRVVAVGHQGVQVTLSTVREIVRRMAALPGERTIVLVSPGFLTIEPDALAVESQVIDLAAQSNVTVSALDARGVYTTSLAASEHIAGGPGVVQYQSEMKRSSMSSEENPLSEFANGTGGNFFHNSNDLDTGFKRLAEVAEYVYLVEISLDDAKPDGHYHRLKVSVDREGLQLQARQGYFMPKPDKKK
jgi:VWFA-related protein